MSIKTLKSYAKINLFLDIVGKREDNYHLIESLFHTIELYDEIIIKESENYSIKTVGTFALDDSSEDNIVTKVFRYFKEYQGLKKNYSIEIKKNIPTGAGLGGGSSNAACLMKYLNLEIEKSLDTDELIKLSPKFGADVAFFIDGGCQWAGGIGERLERLITLPYSILLVYPNIHISTKDAYRRFDKAMFDKGEFKSFKDIVSSGNIDFNIFKDKLYNIFEENIFSFNSEIKDTKESIERVIDNKVVMSGSGSSLFAIYNNKKELEKAYLKLKENSSKLKSIYSINLI